MLTKEQWKQALDELSESSPMFRGMYYHNEKDIEDYMDGIEAVIEWLADKAEDDARYDAFLNNRILSRARSITNTYSSLKTALTHNNNLIY